MQPASACGNKKADSVMIGVGLINNGCPVQPYQSSPMAKPRIDSRLRNRLNSDTNSVTVALM